MARCDLLISRQAEKFLSNLDARTRRRIILEIKDLENFPLFNDRHDLAKLKGHRDYYRLRTGDVRTIFKIDKQEKRIYVEKMERRESAYEK
jgi:mRNA-degrading endonuclease RelE of RelBE toxin-antitoxin system